MASMFGNLEIGRKSLQAQQLGLQVTGNNIANVNTPGYSRQQVEMKEAMPIRTQAGVIGTGVDIETVRSVRDRFIELRLSQGIQQNGEQEGMLSALEQVQASFTVNDTGLQDSITQFYSSFSTLANDPESAPLRNSVLTQAQNMTSAFRSAAQQLTDIRQNMNLQVSSVVDQINSLAGSISALNLSVVEAESGGADASGLRDQRGQLLNKLSELVDVSHYEAQDGTLNISVAGGQTLVTAGFVQPLSVTSTPPAGMFQVMSGLNDVTNTIKSGKLAGLIQARDNLIPGYQTDLDNLASQMITSVNAQHQLGIDLQGNAGQDFFNPVAAGASAALTFSVNAAISSDADKIAASQPDPLPTLPAPTPNPGHSGAPGDNSNALAIAGLASQTLAAGGTATFTQAFAALQFKIGNDTQSAKRGVETQGALLTQLNNLRDSVSGVSLDEEAIDLVKYQRAYQASSRYISIIDQLTSEMMTILAG